MKNLIVLLMLVVGTAHAAFIPRGGGSATVTVTGTGNGIGSQDGLGTNTTFYDRINIGSNIVSVGGNTHGANSTDLQMVRWGSTNVSGGRTASILGGENNTVSGNYSTVIGGTNNWISGKNSVIAGGKLGAAVGGHSFIGAGYTSGTLYDGWHGLVVSGHNSGIMVGEDCAVNATQSAILVGNDSTVNGTFSAIAAGNNNTIYGDNAQLAGHGANCFIGAGVANKIGTGQAGIADAVNSFTAGPSYGFIGSGAFNFLDATSEFGSILGGRNNRIAAIGGQTIGSYLTNTGNWQVSIGYSNLARLNISPDNGVEMIGPMILGATIGASAFKVDANGKPTKSNGDTLAGNGFASVVGNVALLSQSASIGTTTLFTAPAAGLYLAFGQLECTTTGSGTVTVTVSNTDDVGATSKTSTTQSLTATGRLVFSYIPFVATSGSTITYATTVAGGGSGERYAVYLSIIRLN